MLSIVSVVAITRRINSCTWGSFSKHTFASVRRFSLENQNGAAGNIITSTSMPALDSTGQLPPFDLLARMFKCTEKTRKGRLIYVQHGWSFNPRTWHRLKV